MVDLKNLTADELVAAFAFGGSYLGYQGSYAAYNPGLKFSESYYWATLAGDDVDYAVYNVTFPDGSERLLYVCESDYDSSRVEASLNPCEVF